MHHMESKNLPTAYKSSKLLSIKHPLQYYGHLDLHLNNVRQRRQRVTATLHDNHKLCVPASPIFVYSVLRL